ncbi:MAG TPA: LytTR family DNA-binding domain-containing protein [Sediminibacterium sp.]|nr:LytTR family DNA-binding domain-containing protein [Sediminibacterium sp.]
MSLNIVIIEDEKMASDDLAEMLKTIDGSINIIKTIGSVKDGQAYFSSNHSAQLIFSDIQLCDGYSFEIFATINITIPVIYCTAYNQHALEAFDNNGIAYVLKPYSIKLIAEALGKYKKLLQSFSNPLNHTDLLVAIGQNSSSRPQSLLVNSKNKIIPVKISAIALFSVESKNTFLITFQNQKFSLNYTLDELETICGSDFFRANRQYLINRESIREVLHYGFRKLFVSLIPEVSEEIIVNKVKAPSFLNWLKA